MNIRQRLLETTPGPWYASENYLIGGWWVQNAEQIPLERELCDFAERKDAEFIAQVRNELAVLLEIGDELRKAAGILYDDVRDYEIAQLPTILRILKEKCEKWDRVSGLKIVPCEVSKG